MEMSLTISIFAVLVFIIIVNTSLDHLFNWWFREVYKNMDEDGTILIPFLSYLVKFILLFGILNNILN